MLIKNLASKEPSALGLDTYYKQYYLCFAAAAATMKWYFHYLVIQVRQMQVILTALIYSFPDN